MLRAGTRSLFLSLSALALASGSATALDLGESPANNGGGV
ncbi:exported hypothetical protein [Rhodospirillaceae bacterium LM-1]|nr:exported hypothetical protein [Rhodospirillaceae bacterium LM-1]